MSATTALIKAIRDNLSQSSASKKDEIVVMQAMLNDKDYKVDVYSGSSVEQYCPSEDARKIVSSVLVDATKMPKSEADVLADKHEFGKQEAISFIGISKEFIHTYISTGRKLPLGGRKLSNVSLSEKVIDEKVKKFPKKSDVIGADGKPVYESVDTGEVIPKHMSIRVSGSCPSWVK